MRFQSYATPVKKLTDPSDPSAYQTHGARFPVVLNITEDFSYASASAPYGDLLNSLRELVKTLAILVRQNPEDFAFDAPAAVSGFSKLVSSLPKMEARQERATRARAIEQEELLPMMVAGFVSTGALPKEAMRLEPRVEFAPVEFPMSPSEFAQDLDTRIRYNLTTPAKELARKRGISVDAARVEIEANAEENGSTNADPAAAAEEPKRDIFSQLINGGRKTPKVAEDADTE
jgi:hypothetical protein